MSGIINKVKAKVEEMKADHNTSGSSNAGPHGSNAANKADPRVDSDLDGRGVGHGTTGTHAGTGLTGTHHTTTTGTHSGTGLTGTHHTTNTTAGPHDSNMANKMDPRVDSDLSGGHAGSNAQYTTTGTTGHSTTGIGSNTHSGSGLTGSNTSSNTTTGPHNSNMLNKLDPRVDSDLSGGHPGSNAAYTTTGNTGTSSGFSSTTSNTYGSTNAGPHNTNTANKLDPRVDSDLDGGRHAGMNQTTGHHGTTGLTGTSGTTGYNTHGSTNAGPHNSNMANKIDPRVDSDLDGGRHAGMNQTTGHHGTTGLTGTSGTTGYNTHGSTNAGPHDSNMANKFDPRVDSDLDGGRHGGMNQTTNTHGSTGLGSNTHSTQPVHNSNLLNKLDPRVDSTPGGTTHNNQY